MKLSMLLAENAQFNGFVQRLSQRFGQLTQTQQIGCYALLVAVLGALLFFKVIAPLNASRAAAQQRVPVLDREYALMQSQALEIESLRKQGAIPITAAAVATPVKPTQAFSAASVSAQFGSTAVVTMPSAAMLSLSQSGTTVAQFIENTTAFTAATGATLGDFTLKPDATVGLVSVTAQFHMAGK